MAHCFFDVPILFSTFIGVVGFIGGSLYTISLLRNTIPSETAFEQYDSDKNGYLDKESLKHI